MNHLNIFELRAEIGRIVDDIVDAELAGDTDKVNALYAELDQLYDARSTKREGYVHIIKNALNTAKGCKSEADFFDKRATALNNLAKRLKETLHDDLVHHDEESVTAGKYKIARQNLSLIHI